MPLQTPLESSLAMADKITVECVLVDLSLEPCVDAVFRQDLDRILDETSCCDARTWLSALSDGRPNSDTAAVDSATRERIKHDICKFVKIQDKYMALGSALLKSRAFLQTHVAHQQQHHQDSRCLIELPRTQHRKPFVPVQGDSSLIAGSPQEVDIFPLSISHQFPFVGSSRLVVATESPTESPTLPLPVSVGLDIVIFEEYSPRMYESNQEFMDVFRDNFTAWEWKQIEAGGGKNNTAGNEGDETDDQNALRELYLRWAVKEAYTKALGVGLGFDFASFETRMNNHVESLWAFVSSSSDTESNLVGTVVIDPGTRKSRSEKWVFRFKPLFVDQASGGGSDDRNMVGCACVCTGPLAIDCDETAVEYLFERSSLARLVAWHKGND